MKYTKLEAKHCKTMEIRWYHWMVYRLFHWVWNPIFEQNPQMTQFMVNHMNNWLEVTDQIRNNDCRK
jgi:hypothetical protein